LGSSAFHEQRSAETTHLEDIIATMSSYTDVIILGAGAAGMSAAIELSRAGLKVLILEARDRVGGRMFTVRDPALAAPIELGAEFIHGRPSEIWDLLRQARIEPREVTGEDWCARDGKLSPCDFFSEIDEFLKKMDDRGPDESFLEFLQRNCPGPAQAETCDWARRYVTGFHAADPALVSVHSLVMSAEAEEKIDGDRAFRIPGGYEWLVEYFRHQLSEAGVVIHLNKTADSVSWSRRQAKVQAQSAEVSSIFETSRVLVTLPLGVLQAETHDRGTVKFSPELPAEKKAALSKLAMGKVIRVTLTFRERFWDNLQPPQSEQTLSNMRFLFGQQDPFPTWWTTMPEKWPVITGWAPFQCADRLSGKSEAFVREQAIQSLAAALNFDQRKLSDLCQGLYFHDWESDPFSRGAYSYVRVGGDRAQHDLAAPVDETLFFAGEATDITGNNGTVHGAIASGRRAAQQILS
jgi:monoamine oxidase